MEHIPAAGGVDGVHAKGGEVSGASGHCVAMHQHPADPAVTITASRRSFPQRAYSRVRIGVSRQLLCEVLRENQMVDEFHKVGQFRWLITFEIGHHGNLLAPRNPHGTRHSWHAKMIDQQHACCADDVGGWPVALRSFACARS